MRKTAAAFLTMACLLVLVPSVILGFRRNPVVSYYSSYAGVVHMLAIATLSGTALMVYRRMPPHRQRAVAVLGVGITALILWGATAYVLYPPMAWLARYISLPPKGPHHYLWRYPDFPLTSDTLMISGLFVAAVVAESWFVFRRVLRREEATQSDASDPSQPAPGGVEKAPRSRNIRSWAVHLPCALVLLACFQINVRGYFLYACTEYGRLEGITYGHGWPFCYAYHGEDFLLFHYTGILVVSPLAAMFEILVSVILIGATALVMPARFARWRHGFQFTIADLLSLTLTVAVVLGVVQSQWAYPREIQAWDRSSLDLVSWQHLGWFSTVMVLFGIACTCDLLLSWAFKACSRFHAAMNPEHGRDQPGNTRESENAPE